MKVIVTLLVLGLLANLLFLAWAYWMSRRKHAEQNQDSVEAGCSEKPGASKVTSSLQDPKKSETSSSAVCSCFDQAFLSEGLAPESDKYFLILPYLQIGEDPDGPKKGRIDICFSVPASLEGSWRIELAACKSEDTVDQSPSDSTSAPAIDWLPVRHVRIEGVPRHNRHQAVVSGLSPGMSYHYRIYRDDQSLFESVLKTPESPDRHRFAIVGDMGNGSVECAQIAHQIWKHEPDILGITGDVVYRRGTIEEYLSRYFPIYNRHKADLNLGAPLLRSIPSFTSLGNHCVGKLEHYKSSSFDEVPDLHAYFLYWSLPLNGPVLGSRSVSGSGKNMPDLIGAKDAVDRFLCAGGERFPRMAHYSFDFGNVHWLVLDANAYMDWTDEELNAWVEEDLSKASHATWKLVNFHQPGFTSNIKHRQEKRMRLLSETFERHGVDIVFSGHAHFYECSYPLKFSPRKDEYGRPVIGEDGDIQGNFTLDKVFDGETVTRPDGVIYIVTGAGGARLDPMGTQWRKHLWMPFTRTVIGDHHSFTLCDVDGRTLAVKQVSASGQVLDSFTVTK